MGSTDRVQELVVRVSALSMALDRCLAALAVEYGYEARRKIELLRDDLIQRFKESGIPPDRELEHAKIVGPAIDVLHTIFDDALRNLPGQ
jgi:hypothetical protein